VWRERGKQEEIMAGICQDRVVIVTGAGRGIGRGHALEFARQGARVVVNDLGATVDGVGGSITPAQEVVSEIEALGGEAVVNGDDVADWAGAKQLIQTALDRFGRLDVLVNNAGILRDRMMINMTEDDWDAVVRVHMKGTFAPCHFAANYWRERAKAGEPADARIINTSSGSGLYGNIGQSHYGAAKAGIASFTVITSRELERYGITVNAITPGARTRMSEDLIPDDPAAKPDFDFFAAENVAPLVVWLGSAESTRVPGPVFELRGGVVGLAEGWTHGPSHRRDERWDPAELGPVVEDLLSKAREAATLEV